MNSLKDIEQDRVLVYKVHLLIEKVRVWTIQCCLRIGVVTYICLVGVFNLFYVYTGQHEAIKGIQLIYKVWASCYSLRVLFAWTLGYRVMNVPVVYEQTKHNYDHSVRTYVPNIDI